MTRSTWDEAWMEVAEAIARRSPCTRAQVGAVVVGADNRYCVVGYNGLPAGLGQQCPRENGGPKESCSAVHAEANALLQSDRTRHAGGTIYVTRAPCRACALLIANSGLARVRFGHDEDDLHAEETTLLLIASGLKVYESRLGGTA